MYTTRTVKFILTLFCIQLLVGHSVPAQVKGGKKAQPWGLELWLNSYYDDNILKNSDLYINKFLNNEDPGRFHINRYDDLVMDYEARFSYSDQFIKEMTSIITASASFNSYTYNSVKNWSSYYIGLQQFLGPRSSILLSYTYIPDFYVKHYRDDDWVEVVGYTSESFQPYSFSKNEYSTWFQQVFTPDTKARFYFSYMKYFHNEHFTEYDCTNLLFGLRVFQSFSRIVSADAEYSYINSDAKGYDSLGETKETSDDGDASNYEHVFSAGINIQLPEIFKLTNSLGINGEYSRRYYTTPASNVQDKNHAGRQDDYYSLEIDYFVSIMKNFSVSAFYKSMSRNADTTVPQNSSYLSAEKDFSQNLLGLNFIYKFTF